MSEKVQKIVQQKILEMLDEGTIPWRKGWNIGGKFAKNLVSNNIYQGSNFFLLNCQSYTSPYWMSYKQAKDHGGHVKKGESSSIVTFWTTLMYKNKETKEEERPFPFMRFTRVWNLEQTEDVKVPERSEDVIKKYNHDPIENCEQILKEYKDPPKTIWGRNPCYNVAQDFIGMPKLENFISPEEYYAAWFHEMGHSTRHLSRLGRVKTSKAKEELVAEMTACFLCAEAGISTAVIDNQADYIKGWRDSISKDPKLVVQAASKAQKAADYIMNITEISKMKDKQKEAA